MKYISILFILIITTHASDMVENAHLKAGNSMSQWRDSYKIIKKTNNLYTDVNYYGVNTTPTSIYIGTMSNVIKYTSRGKGYTNSRIRDYFNKYEHNLPYVAVFKNKYPYFRIIKGFVTGGGAIMEDTHGSTYSTKVNNIKYNIPKKNIAFISWNWMLSHYNWNDYGSIFIKKFSREKDAEMVSDVKIFASNNKYGYYSIRKKVFGLGALEYKNIEIKKFGEVHKKLAIRLYQETKLTPGSYAMSYSKEGAIDMANYLCRKALAVKYSRENNIKEYKKLKKRFPIIHNKLYQCEHPFEHYMEDDEVWTEFKKLVKK